MIKELHTFALDPLCDIKHLEIVPIVFGGHLKHINNDFSKLIVTLGLRGTSHTHLNRPLEGVR